MPVRKIACAVDFSRGSDVALDAAIALAQHERAQLVIAHAWQVPALAYGLEAPIVTPGFFEDLRREGARGLAAARVHAAAAGIDATTPLVEGAPADAIAALVADDLDIDLLVVGTHGRSGFARALLGSVAEALVRRVPSSVLVVRDGGTWPPRTALCAVDFTDASRAAARMATDVTVGAEPVALLHVVEIPSAFDRSSLDVISLEREERAAQSLEQVAEGLEHETRVAVRAETRLGAVAPEILAALDARPRDLVVLAASEHPRRFGSVAQRIVRHAPCSVLVTRTRANCALAA